MKLPIIIFSVILLIILVLTAFYFKENYTVTNYTRIGQRSINYPAFYNAATNKETK